MVNFSGILYMSGSFLLSYLAYRLWPSYQKSKNPVTKNFAYVGFFLALSLFIFGLSCLIFSQNYRLLKIGSQFALIPFFIGWAFGLRAFFYSKLEQIPPDFAFLVAAFFGSIILFLQIRYAGYPRVTHGITEWNLHPTVFLLFTLIVLALVIPLTITFIHSGLKNPEIRTRSFTMATGFFLAGIGTILHSSNLGWLMVAFGSIIIFFGFISVAFAFFFTKPSVE